MIYTEKAHAKINICFDIKGKITHGNYAGYHEVETILQKTELHDIVTLNLHHGRAISVKCDVERVPCDSRNIAYRAAQMFLSASGKRCGVDINIEKHIPVEGGLGGSSTDGAAVLTLLNRALGRHGQTVFSRNRLMDLAAKLSADMPFFIFGNTALARGIGEKLVPLPRLPRRYLAIVQPKFSVNTTAAYKLYNPNRTEYSADFPPPKGLWNRSNIFETLIDDSRIFDIKKEFAENGAEYALMTGSGSAVYGVFVNENAACAALAHMEYPVKILTKTI